MLGKMSSVLKNAAFGRRKERPRKEAEMSLEKLHAPLENGAPWTSRMKSSKEKADCMLMKEASLNLMEFRYYGCSSNSNNSIFNHYCFAGGFNRPHS
jgi:hypothetical protein